MPSNPSTVDEILKLSNNVEVREKLIDTLRVAEQCIKKINELRNELRAETFVLNREKLIETLDEIMKEF